MERLVKPERDGQERDALRKRWGHYADKRPQLRAAVGSLTKIIAIAQTASRLAFARVPTGAICSHTVIVFGTESDEFFGIVHARPQEVWTREFAASGLSALHTVRLLCDIPFYEQQE